MFKEFLKTAVPNAENKIKISTALAKTYPDRRAWILEKKVTCTEILNEYQHLASYGGEMVSNSIEEAGNIPHAIVDRIGDFSPFSRVSLNAPLFSVNV